MKKRAFGCVLLIFLIITAAPAQSPPQKDFDLTDKIQEGKQMLESVALTHSSKISKGDFQWKEAALAVVDPIGKIVIIKIRKEQKFLLCLTPGYFINFESRPSGITLNGKNIALVVKNTRWETLTVVAIKWLETDEEKVLVTKGKKQRWMTQVRARAVIYVPYSTGLHQEELVKAGNKHFDSRSQTAYNNLDNHKVKSLVHPSENVTQSVSHKWIKRLCLIEQADPKEYLAFRNGTWKHSPYERVLVRLGANGGSEFQTRNYAGAVGLMQFTNNGSKRHLGTWDIVRTRYPAAQLPSFHIGSVDHVWSIMAAVLLHDLNTWELVESFGISILQDPQLEHYLAAAYNGGIGRVKTGIRKYGRDWTRALLAETRGYVEQLEFLHKNPINPA